MKPITKLKWLIAVAFVAISSQALLAQTKANVFDDKTPITWLGLDFSQARFIGPATQFKDAGQITSADFRDKYTVGWNELFLKEPKKYKVADFLHRSSVTNAIEVSENANSKLSKEFFSENISDYKTITESAIAEQVKNYDFKNNQGIGCLIFVEGMSKAKEKAGGWVTFVDMKSKTVLFTTYVEGDSGGFGFKNYWAKSFLNMLKATESGYSKWKKG